MRLIESTDYQQIAALDAAVFPGDYPIEGWVNATWWIGWEKGQIACYCGVKEVDGVAYLNRSGVLPKFRGQGFQRKMITKRLKWAVQNDLDCSITDTVMSNSASSNNLIRSGFLLFEPENPWACSETSLYWRRDGKSK